MKIRRTLRLRRDVLTELTDSELTVVAGAEAVTRPQCPVVELQTVPLFTCRFECTEA